MFDPQDGPRIFAVPLGVDFTKALVAGLDERTQSRDPIQIAQTELYLNTERLRRSVIDSATLGPARLLPKIRLVTELPNVSSAKPLSNLEQQLELADLIRPLLQKSAGLAPRQAAFDLAVSLSDLMDEIAIERVSGDAISDLSIPDESGHWRKTLEFLKIAQAYVGNTDRMTAAQRSRLAVDQWVARVQSNPPQNAMIVAGSTGSRKTTFDMMVAAARCPQGAIILPGFDPHAPWSDLMSDFGAEDHPQYRFAKLFKELGVTPKNVRPWSTKAPVSSARNAFVSLSLHPAPVTNRWLRDGPRLENLGQAFEAVTWVEAPDQRVEAQTIAARLRVALDNDETVAVISPDRMLTRRINAALSKWGIVPDDSAGVPLSQTPPGRLLLELTDLMTGTVTVPKLLSLLKHPLTHTGADRGPHLKHTRDYELKLRREGPPFPDERDLLDWSDGATDRKVWVNWLTLLLQQCSTDQALSLADWVARTRGLATDLSNGPGGETGRIWDEESGRSCLEILDTLNDASGATGQLEFADFSIILRRLLQSGQVRQQMSPHPSIKIWGTLEARAQGADLVVLAGLNEGVWPGGDRPDPWMNRTMRRAVDLLSPDRAIGLSAHDYQIAMSNAEVWVTRSVRSSDAETVASRWLNRFSNLLNGLSDHDTHPEWDAMTRRGKAWMAAAAQMEQPVPADKAQRPAPCPPLQSRPSKLPVTAITRLIRDPYAIYAQYILGLYPLDPLLAEPDALLRGIVVHSILEDALEQGPFASVEAGVQALRAATEAVLARDVPWPAERRRWQALLDRNAPLFMAEELERQKDVTATYAEGKGQAFIPDIGFTLTAKADRIDLLSDRVMIYDYKTGKLPSAKSQIAFDKQLLLEIELLKRGGFPDIDTKLPVGAEYIGVGSELKRVPANVDDAGDSWQGLIRLITRYQSDTQGYAARRALLTTNDRSRYDHLSRYGEWDVTKNPIKQVLT